MSDVSNQSTGIKVFISYSHQDKKLEDELAKSLASLRNEGKISLWHDRNLRPGDNWVTEIDQQLNDAQLILLLVSPDFISSDYLYGNEMTRAIQRMENGEARVVPIILRDAAWQNTPIRTLQVLPKNGWAVTSSHWSNRNEALDNVAQGIRRIIEELPTRIPEITTSDSWIWDYRHTVRLAKDILSDEESRDVYRDLLARRARMSIDPEYSNPSAREEANTIAANYTIATQEYILFAARLVERLAQYAKEVHFQQFRSYRSSALDALNETIAEIWAPLPHSALSDFRWLEATYAAVMSNELVRAVEEIYSAVAQNRPRTWPLSDGLVLPESSEEDPPYSLLGIETVQELTGAFRRYYWNTNGRAAIAIEAISTQLGLQYLVQGKLDWPRLESPRRFPELKTPLFEATFDGDPVVEARELWLAAKAPRRRENDPGPPSDNNPKVPPEAITDRVPEVKGRQGAPASEAKRYVVWYATNRALTDSGNPHAQQNRFDFKPDEHDEVRYGQCVVDTPPGYRRASGGGTHLTIVDHPPARTLAQFFGELRDSLGQRSSEEREILIFLHGYKTSFEDAIKSAAQLASDLNFSGEIACFCWPSIGRGEAYVYDRKRVRDSTYNSNEFLVAMLSRTSATKVHVIAHSMGNQLLANAVAGIVGRLEDRQFDQLILAAPDVDVEDFCSNAAHYYPQLAKRTTLYTSHKDVALYLSGSRFIHDAPRVGVHGTPLGFIGPDWPITVVPKVDTVEISQVNPSWHGHSYHSDSDCVLDDIRRLLQDGAAPSKRGLAGATEERSNPRCRIANTKYRTYWILARLLPPQA